MKSYIYVGTFAYILIAAVYQSTHGNEAEAWRVINIGGGGAIAVFAWQYWYACRIYRRLQKRDAELMAEAHDPVWMAAQIKAMYRRQR